MKAIFLIIIGIILIVATVVITDIYQNKLEWDKVMQEDAAVSANTKSPITPEPKLESNVNENNTVSETKKSYTVYDISGVKQTYRIGEPISFTETVQGYANPCVHPHYEILDGNTLETVWQYKIVYPCPFIKDPQQFKKTNTIPNGDISSPILNQTGTYILRTYYSYSDGYKDVTFSVVDELTRERENEN